MRLSRIGHSEHRASDYRAPKHDRENETVVEPKVWEQLGTEDQNEGEYDRQERADTGSDEAAYHPHGAGFI